MASNERGHRLAAPAIALAVSIVLALTPLARAETPVVGGGQFPVFSFSPSISPRLLSKKEPSAIKLGLLSNFFPTDEFRLHPAPLAQLKLLLDRHLELSTRGIPSCPPHFHATKPKPKGASDPCKPALVGNGKAKLFFAFPDSKPFPPLDLEVLLYNGGTRGAVTKLWIYIAVPVPVPRTIVIPVELKEIDQGMYGTEVLVPVPEIVDGYGLVERLSLNINREYLLGGERRSVASFRCANGKFQYRAEASFTDGTQAAVPPALRTCSVG